MRDLERRALSSIPASAPLGSSTRCLRQLRPQMEPLTGTGLGAVVSAVIPCLDEEAAIGAVVRDVLSQGVVEVIVVDGGSRDRTGACAAEAGGRVVVEPRRGYGRAIM